MGETELYDPDNRWRGRHPAEKAVLAGGMLAVVVAIPPGGVTGAVAILMTGAALFGARVSWRRFRDALLVPAGFLAVGTLPILVSFAWDREAGGPTVGVDPPAAGGVVLRGLAAITCLAFFATTTPVCDVLELMRAVRCPGFVVELTMLTYRFSQELVASARTVRLAQRLRLGYGSAADFRSLGLLGATLLPRAVGRARRLERGLAARGYDGDLPVLSTARPASRVVIATVVGLETGLAAVGFLTGRGGA